MSGMMERKNRRGRFMFVFVSFDVVFPERYPRARCPTENMGCLSSCCVWSFCLWLGINFLFGCGGGLFVFWVLFLVWLLFWVVFGLGLGCFVGVF